MRILHKDAARVKPRYHFAMPLYDFVCPKGHVHERYFSSRTAVLDETGCGCGERAKRKTFNRVSFSGPMWSQLDDLSRLYGREVKDHRDIKRWEKEQNLIRMDSYDAKVAQEEEGHINEHIKKVRDERGQAAALDVVRETNMREALGWSSEKFNQWKERDNESQRLAADPTVAPILQSDG